MDFTVVKHNDEFVRCVLGYIKTYTKNKLSLSSVHQYIVLNKYSFQRNTRNLRVNIDVAMSDSAIWNQTREISISWRRHLSALWLVEFLFFAIKTHIHVDVSLGHVRERSCRRMNTLAHLGFKTPIVHQHFYLLADGRLSAADAVVQLLKMIFIPAFFIILP